MAHPLTHLTHGIPTRRPFHPAKTASASGKLVMPAELQRIHQAVLDAPVLRSVTDEMRAVVETLWPDLLHKLTT
jgi:hypothetical protein